MRRKAPWPKISAPPCSALMSEPGLAGCLQALLDGQRIPAALWAALRDALHQNLRRRGLISRPPAYVGLDDVAAWTDDGALDALAAEFYRAYMLPRLRPDWPSRSEDRLAGLIDLMARQFLGDRQRDQDPIGYFVHQNVVQALQIAVERGALEVAPRASDDEPGDGAAGRAHRAERFSPPGTAAERIPPERWHERLAAQDGWGDLVPRLGSASVETQTVLAGAVAAAAARPPPAALTARDVVQAIRDEVRAALPGPGVDPDVAVGWDRGEDGAAELVRVVLPGEAPPGPDFARLAERLRARVAQLACQDRVRAGLLRVIDQIAEAGDEPPPPAELGRRLGIPRSTLHELLQRLKPLVMEEWREPG